MTCPSCFVVVGEIKILSFARSAGLVYRNLQLVKCLFLKTFSAKSRKKEVTITIGIGFASKGVFKPVRGKSLPLKVNKHASAQTVLDEALKKRRSYDRTFRNYKSYKLCFPDGSEVTTFPETKARTCGPVLEVPTTYHSYNELSEEFENLISNKEA